MKIISFVIFILLVVIVMACLCKKHHEDYNQDDCVCYTDYVNLYNLPLLKGDVERLKVGNWPTATERAIGVKNPAFKPGDDVYILMNGSDEFKNIVQTAIEKYAQPFVNLNFKFTTDTSLANYTITRGNPPSGYTGWAAGIGNKKVAITLGNERQMNILHELGHAMGMQHENENQSNTNVAKALVDKIEHVYGTDTVKSMGLMAPGAGKGGGAGGFGGGGGKGGSGGGKGGGGGGRNATPFDIKSIMGIPNANFKSQRTSEYSDGDKLWLKNTYGEPGSGKDGKSGW